MALEHTDIHTEKNESGPLPTLLTKINLKCIINVNLAKIINLLEEKTEKNLHDFREKQDFLKTQKALTIKA